MKYLHSGFITLLMLLAGAQSAFAQYDYPVPTVVLEPAPFMRVGTPTTFFYIGGIVTLIGIVIGIFAFVFWLMMLVDALQNEKEDKILWVGLIVFLPIIGALLYYFLKKRHRASVAN